MIPCFILARKGSKGLKNKNLIKLNNKPLIEYTIEYAKKCKYISHIVISTDDIRIVKIAKKYKCIVIYPRPSKLSNDTAQSEPALLHAAKYFIKNIGEFDIYAYLQITEPLRPKNILNLCIKKLIDNKRIDSAFAGYEMHKNFWIKRKNFFKRISPLNEINLPRQIKKAIYREDTGVALASRFKFLKQLNRIGSNVYIAPYNSFGGIIDIHTSKDLKIANFILTKKIKY